ncbi:hypothetical protein [Nostoc sp.]|uniref:hypothetical protein n=1 Tax=Nostoc sp. TaxID=1180 RepID=UPI002FF4F633
MRLHQVQPFIAIYSKRNIFFAHRLVKVVLQYVAMQHNYSRDRYYLRASVARKPRTI